MSTTTEIRTPVPAGTWQLDPVHSSVGFELAYMGGSFRGRFRDVAAVLTADGAPALTGSAQVTSVDVKDENLAAHLQSPEFFDAERHPELRFTADEIAGGAEVLAVRGELTIKGVTRPVELAGTVTGPITDPYGRERVGLSLATTVDRTDFGLDWNVPLPTGEPALANDVTVAAELYFVEAA
jgi:polyisoprenoid-binding protein YceI